MKLGPPWRVRRTGGLLVRGFVKRFAPDGASGMTYLWRIPIGRFDVVERDGGRGLEVELRYRRWPVVDVLAARPHGGGSIRSAGYVALGSARVRFCRFRLER
jgi:hypothetical protein